MSALSVVLLTRVGRRRKFWKVSCTECRGQRHDFELIPTVKIETRIPVRGNFGMNFRRPVIIAELWRHEVERR